jgi:hypothetical protein
MALTGETLSLLGSKYNIYHYSHTPSSVEESADGIIFSFRNVMLKTPIGWTVDNGRVDCNTRQSETFRFTLQFFPFTCEVKFHNHPVTWSVETAPLNEELTVCPRLFASESHLNVGHPYEIYHKYVLIAGGDGIFNN